MESVHGVGCFGPAERRGTIFTEEGPELRATTQEQRDAAVAARAKGEAARAASRAKEKRGRVGGPPPGFKPKGERAPPGAEDTGPPTDPRGSRSEPCKGHLHSPRVWGVRPQRPPVLGPHRR
jgi:hypothetical protein